MPSSAVRGQIPVLCATGTGRTTLAAFHAALETVDLGHYNLVRLSSVVPPRTGVDTSGAAPVPSGAWGDRMYCVYAEQRATTIGAQAWAGIGWVQRRDGEGGLFVEHEGPSEQYVTDQIVGSLADMVAGREDFFSEPQFVINGAVCEGDPVCSLVIAPYAAASWDLGS